MVPPGSSPPGPEPVAVDLRDYVDFDLGAAAGRRVLSTDVVAVDLLCLEPGQELAARTLPVADAIYTVLGGRAWVVTDAVEVTLEPLQAVVVPSTVPHGLRNDGADPLILQVILSPPDELPASVFGPAPPPPGSGSTAPAGRPADRLRRDRLRKLLGG